MVLFHNESDRQMFLLEVGKRIDEGDSPSDHNLFIQRRNKIGSMFANFRKSRQTDMNWNRNKFKIMQGIRQYAHSIEGRKMHRQLGRFLTTKNILPRDGLFAAREELEELKELKLAVMEELQFYQSLHNQLILEEIIELISGTLEIQ